MSPPLSRLLSRRAAAARPPPLPLLPLLLLLAPRGAASIRLGLVPDQPRCVSEQLPAKTLLHGDWELGALHHHETTLGASGYC